MHKSLIKAIALTIGTFIGIGLFFYYMEGTRNNFMLVSFFSLSGFLTAFSEYLIYKQSKKVTRWHD